MNKLLYHIMQAEGYEQDKLLPFLTKAQNGVEVPPVNSILTDGMPQLNIPASAEDDFRWRTITPSQIPVMPRSVAAPSKPAYRGASLVDFLKSQGMDSSKAARKKLAEEFRVQNYDFSAAKNLELLGKLYDVNEDEETAAQIFRQAERVRGTQQPARTGAAPQTRTAAGPQNRGRKISPEEFNRRLSMMVGFDVAQGVPADRFKINAPKLSLTPKVQYDKFSLAPRMEYKGLKFGPSKPATQPAVQPAQQQQSTAPVAQPAAVNNTGFRFDLNPTAKPNPNALFNFNPLGLTYPTARTNNATPVKSRPVANVRQQTKPAPVDKPWYEDAWDAVSGTVSEAWDGATDLASDAWDNTSSAASQAWNAAGNTLNSWWDAYSKAVNENPILSRASFTMSPAGIHPQGAINMTRDLTSNILGVFSDDLAQKYNNWSNRQQAFRNMGDESKSRVIVPPYNYAPMYMTGDTIPDGNRQYHLPESMDVNALRFGVRNRGDFNPIQTEAASITSFHPFVDAKNYFSEATEDPANATYLGVSPDGRLRIGGRKDFEGKDVKVSRVFSNKVVDFVREPSGAIKKVPAGAKVNRNAFSPAVTVINDEGKTVQGKLNLALPQGEKGDEAFGVATGGRFILQTPDGQTRLVSGSLKNIEEEFKRIKGNNPYVNVISLDNGSFSRGLRTRDQRLTAQDLRGYDNLNTSGGNFAYLLPNQIKSRPEAKFAEFEKEATRILQSKYPGRRVEVRFQQDGLYDKKGGRDISSQEDIQKEGNSQTKVSLHNFGAARDYQLVVDGKVINPNTNRDLYKEILWTAADNTGTYHLEDWDPVHISLAKEGQKTAFDELKAKYPELLNTETFKKNLEFIKQRKDQDEEYRVLYELMTNFQPFTGKPRTVAPKKKAFGGSMIEGFEYPVQDDNIFVAAFGGETPKFQTGGEKVKFKNRSGRVIELDTASPRYKRLYNEGIGRWQRFDPATKTWVSSNESDPNAEFVSSPKTLAEVVVTAKAKPNTVGSYSSAFYKQNPYEAFFKNRYNQLKDEFTSQPQWAQSAVGGWGRDSRQQNIRDQINQEYQQQYIDFVSQNLQKRSPQGNQRRDKWLSGKNFTDKELGFLTGSTNLPQPSLWAQGLQGAYNVADMISLGQLPEENMPGIAKAEVSQYNNPLLALSPLSIPSKMVQSAYKDNYTFKDALAGRPNNASVEEDFLTDPLTYATFGAKGIVSAAPRVGRFMSKIGSKAQFLNNRVPAMSGITGDLSQAANRIDYVLSNPELAKVTIGNVERGNKTILEEGKKIYDDLSSAEGIRRLKEQFRLANPDFNENQLQWLVANRLNEVNDAIRLNQNRFFLEYGKGADNTPTEGAFRTLFPVWNAHFSGYNPFPNIYDVKLPANLFPQKNILGSKSGATNINLVKNTGFENFADPNYRPGSISLGEGLESNVRVLDHEIGHSLQNLGEMPIDHQLLDLMKPKTDLDRLWNMLLPKQSKNDLKYFRFSGGRTYDNEPYPFLVEQRRRMIEDGILSNRYDKVNFAKLLQARINAFKNKSDYANYVEGNRLIKFTPPWKWGKLSSIMNTAPASVPVVGGAAYLASQPGEANLKKKGGPVIDPRGQWAYPGKRTIVPTPTGRITMQGVPYPVYGQDETGFGQMMFPGGEYQFPGQMVDEMPMMRKGGQKKGCPPGFVNIDGKCFDRTSKEYETLYKGGIGYLDKDGTLVSSKTNLPEIVVLPKSTRAFVDDQNFTPSQQYAFEQMGKKYGFPKVRSQKEYADTMPYSPFSKGSAHYWDDTIYADDMQGYMKELAHHVQRDGQIPKWIFNDLPAYIKGKDPYEMPGTVEHTAHSVVEPRLHKEFDKYWDKYILEHRPLEGFEDPKFRRDQMQKAWQNYKSPAKMKKGGQHGGLDRWFAEKWVDVKTGKPCGRQEGENRAYPACRPSRRVSSETPKTSSEMSPAEKAKFKRSKTSSERIPYNHQRKQYGGMSTTDSVRHQANKILQYEQLRGGPGGTPLPHYSDPSYMNMLMNDIYPQVRTLFPNASAMEAAEAMDFIFNAGRDPRIYMLDQYLRSKGQAGIPNRGSFNIDMNKDPQKWAKKKPELDALWNQYASEINNLPVNTRRQFLNKGRDWYYQNINNPSPGVPSSDYYDTWYGRIWNTNDFQPFNPNNPNFKPKKK